MYLKWIMGLKRNVEDKEDFFHSKNLLLGKLKNGKWWVSQNDSNKTMQKLLVFLMESERLHRMFMEHRCWKTCGVLITDNREFTPVRTACGMWKGEAYVRDSAYLHIARQLMLLRGVAGSEIGAINSWPFGNLLKDFNLFFRL